MKGHEYMSSNLNNGVSVRRGRPRKVYPEININYQMMILVIKSKRRMLLISKGSMYDFIIKYIDAGYDVKHTKHEMLSALEQYLTEDTIHQYIAEFECFGICKKDLQSILGIRRSSMIVALKGNGIDYKSISYHTANIAKGRYHIFNPEEILRLNGYKPY